MPANRTPSPHAASKAQAYLMHGAGAWAGLVLLVNGMMVCNAMRYRDWNGLAWTMMIAGIMLSLLALWMMMGAVIALQFPMKIHRKSQRHLNILSATIGLLAVVVFFLLMCWITITTPHSTGNRDIGIVLFLIALPLLSMFFQAGGCWLAIRFKLLKQIYPAGCCEHCGYDLRATLGATCPECGQAFMKQPDKSSTSDLDSRCHQHS